MCKLPMMYVYILRLTLTFVSFTAQQSKEMSVDVSKYLHFASGGKTPLDWDRVINISIISAFLTVLKEKNISPDGILQKLDTLTYAIVFYWQVVLQGNVLEGRHRMSLNASEALLRLKKRYRKKKTIKNESTFGTDASVHEHIAL